MQNYHFYVKTQSKTDLISKHNTKNNLTQKLLKPLKILSHFQTEINFQIIVKVDQNSKQP